MPFSAFGPFGRRNQACGHYGCVRDGADAPCRVWRQPHPLTYDLLARGDCFRSKRFHGPIFLGSSRVYPQSHDL